MHVMNNLRSVDLNLLVVLDALLAERHLSRAASRLNMSQPAVSHALARLRQLLDDPLFRREGGGMVPTVRALTLALPLAEAIAQIRTVLGPDLFEPTAPHVFRLAMSDYGAELVLPTLMRRLRAIAPGTQLIVYQRSREGMIAAVAEGEVDLALGVFPDPPLSVEADLLFTDRYVCLLDPAHQPAWSGTLTSAQFQSASHIHVAVQGEFATELDLHLNDRCGPRRLALILPHWGVAPNVIAGTDMILTVAGRAVPASPDPLVITDPPFLLPPIPFSVIYAKRRKADPAIRWLINQVRNTIGDGA